LAAVATIQFYQKPGCATNARQKRMLEAAGHIVIARSLLTEPWTAEALRGFFGSTPVKAWFNPAAPRIKSGEIAHEKLDASSAIALMLDDPLLIRRPLVEADGQSCAGFDREPVTSLLGDRPDEDVEACRRPQASTPCPDPVPSSTSQPQ
jgi:nitrogenase-associated protein